MKAEEVTVMLDLALSTVRLREAEPAPRARLLSDNGSSYIAADIARWAHCQSIQLDASDLTR
jgi:putative transposase